jgi:putative transposase
VDGFVDFVGWAGGFADAHRLLEAWWAFVGSLSMAEAIAICRRCPPYKSTPMPEYRRNYIKGGVYFFTLVTDKRRPFLTSSLARKCMHESIEKVQRKRPFELNAIVLLSDHLHSIWTLPPDDDDYSTRWSLIKKEFTVRYLDAGGQEGMGNESRLRKRERAIWQRRFWEHTCRDEDDHKRCLDYLHYNPVKHGLATRVRDYEWSSFHRYVRLGEYPLDWGSDVKVDVPGCEWD